MQTDSQTETQQKRKTGRGQTETLDYQAKWNMWQKSDLPTNFKKYGEAAEPNFNSYSQYQVN